MKKRFFSVFCMSLAVFLLCVGCAKKEAATGTEQKETEAETGVYTQEVFAMDTYMSLTAYGEHGEEAVKAAVEEIQRLDDLLSTGKEESEVSQLNCNQGGNVEETVADLLTKSLELYQSTDGLFDISIYPLMQLWGFPTGEYHVPDESEIAGVLPLVNSGTIGWNEESRVLTLQENQQIDFGGIAKGYTSSRVMDIMKEKGVTSAMISLGGNVQVLGGKMDGTSWRVAIQNPDKEGDYLGVLSVKDRAVITSGGYERYFEEDGKTYHHIMDVRTGKPAESGLTSVTIISKDGTLADGLSTSLFVMGLEEAETYYQAHADEFDAVLYTEDGKLYVTQGIAADFTSEQEFEIIEKES